MSRGRGENRTERLWVPVRMKAYTCWFVYLFVFNNNNIIPNQKDS